MDYISLLVFVAVIAAAFIFKVNTGLAAIMASLILVFATGMKEKFIISAFDSKMFLMLFGVMYLFCIAQENKTAPLSDGELCNILQAQRVQISRRSVANYRKELGIPTASVRRRNE